MVSMIAAIGKNNELGLNGNLPWHLPDDFKFFKDKTLGKSIVMGRTTYESLGKALPKRQNIVLTQNKTYQAIDADIVFTPEQALEIASDQDEVMIIGGAQIYKLFLPIADSLYLTHIDGVFEADSYFPELNLAEWEMTWQEPHEQDARHSHDFMYTQYLRRA